MKKFDLFKQAEILSKEEQMYIKGGDPDREAGELSSRSHDTGNSVRFDHGDSTRFDWGDSVELDCGDSMMNDSMYNPDISEHC